MPCGDQHGAERDRDDEDRRDQALVAAISARILNAIGSASPTLISVAGSASLQRGPDRRPQVVGREEVRVVGERAALLRVERQRESVEERIDEQQHHEQPPPARPAAACGRTARAPAAPQRRPPFMRLTRSGRPARARPGRARATLSPSAGVPVARTCSSVPDAVITSTSESRPQYSTLSTRAGDRVEAAGPLAQHEFLGTHRDRSRGPRPAAACASPVSRMSGPDSVTRSPGFAVDAELEHVAIAHEARDVQVGRLPVDVARALRSAARRRPSSRRCGRPATAPRPGRASRRSSSGRVPCGCGGSRRASRCAAWRRDSTAARPSAPAAARSRSRGRWRRAAAGRPTAGPGSLCSCPISCTSFIACATRGAISASGTPRISQAEADVAARRSCAETTRSSGTPCRSRASPAAACRCASRRARCCLRTAASGPRCS